MLRWLLIVGAINAVCLPVVGQNSFVNWENPHVHPLDITPASERLLVVNTADNRLEIFNIVSGTGSLAPAGAVPVGLEPVSVRARSDEQSPKGRRFHAIAFLLRIGRASARRPVFR